MVWAQEGCGSWASSVSAVRGCVCAVLPVQREPETENINCDEVMNPGARYRHLQTVVTLATSGERLESRAGVGCCAELFSACFLLAEAGRC